MAEKPVLCDIDSDEALRFLSETSLFKELPRESLKKFAEKIKVDSFTKDHTVIKKEAPGICLYLIKSGSARVVSESEDEEFTIATIPSGKCFGEMSLLTGEPCCATVKTNEDSRLYSITRNDFDDIISDEPEIYKHFIKLLAERINEQNIKSIDLKRYEIALHRYLQMSKEHLCHDLIWKCKRMREVVRQADTFSKIVTPVTIIGESGTGKEMLSRKIHMDSTRAKFPIIEITIPQERRLRITPVPHDRRQHDHIENELFGNEETLHVAIEGKRIGSLELANKGTLVIKNIENMVLSTQKSLVEFIESGKFTRRGRSQPTHTNVRIIVTTTDFDLMQERLHQRLFVLLSTHRLEIPPLRDRKKDIPSLMKHFVEKVSKIRHTEARKFSKGATNKLLKYDYPGNVKELENVIHRAIILSKEDTDIEEEEIFLGNITGVEDKKRLNLLNIALIKRLCESSRVILTVKTITLIFFILTLCFLAVQPNLLIGGKNITLVLIWQLAMPLSFVVFLLTARFGCGVCPLYSISKLFNHRFNLKITVPSFIKNYDMWITGIGFITILFIEEYFDLASSVNKTAYLIFSILAATIITDFVLEKSAWCRHLCPLGGMAGLFSMSSIIEIRSNKNVCKAICTTHECYKGSEKAGPCPMFLHLQFLSENRNCKICLNCIKNCTHHATRLNIRIPGAEISSLKEPSFAGTVLSILLSGLLTAEIFSTLGAGQVGFPLVFAASVSFALTITLVSSYLTALISKRMVIEELRHFGYTLIPLILFGFISLKAIAVFGNVEGTVMLFTVYKFNVNFTTAFQLLIVLIGLSVTEYLIYEMVRNKITKNKQLPVFVIQGIVPLILSVIYISLFYVSLA